MPKATPCQSAGLDTGLEAAHNIRVVPQSPQFALEQRHRNESIRIVKDSKPQHLITYGDGLSSTFPPRNPSTARSTWRAGCNSTSITQLRVIHRAYDDWIVPSYYVNWSGILEDVAVLVTSIQD